MKLLPTERRKKAEEFKNMSDRLHCIAGGLLMRKALPVSWVECVEYNQHGKPFLRDNNRCFSLSHGGNYSVIAIHSEDIGVDIEKISSEIDSVSKMAARLMFTRRELSWISDKDSGNRFYTLWTKKESILKADGRGFSLPPKSFDVLEDTDWTTETFFYDNHVISYATKTSIHAKWRVSFLDELLSEVQ